MKYMFGPNLRRLRLERGLSQEALADLSGVSRATIRRLETSETARPQATTARFLAEALGVRPDELMGAPAAPRAPEPTPWTPQPRPPIPHLVGRAGDLRRVRDLLGASGGPHTVTLSGPRGVGKTALAQVAAFSSAEELGFRRTIWVSAKSEDLEPRGVLPTRASLSSLSDLLYAIGCAFGHREIGKMDPHLQERMAHQLMATCATLLVLDNLDAVEAEQCEQIARCLRELPEGTKALTTNLRPLGIRDEGSVVVGPLARKDALALIDREARNRQVALTQADRQAIYEAVGGVPVLLIWCVGRLALESRTVAAVLDELTEHRADPYDWCFGQFWSAFADDDCRRLLAAAAISRDPASPGFLGRVADVPDASRREHALLRLSVTTPLLQHDATSDRYFVLPLVRDGALQHLADMPKGRDMWLRAAAYFTDIAESCGDDPNAQWEVMDPDAESAIGIAQWCCSAGEWGTLARLLCHMNQYLYVRCRWEQMKRLNSLAVQHAPRIGDELLVAGLRRDLAWIHLEHGEHDLARSQLAEALPVFQRHNDRRLQSTCLRYLAQMAIREQDYPEAKRLLDQSMQAAARAPESASLLAFLDNLYGSVLLEEGDLAGAERRYRRCLRRWRSMPQPNLFSICVVMRNLGALALRGRHYKKAALRLRRCIQLCAEVGREDIIGGAKLLLAQLEAERGHTEQALALAREAEIVFTALGLQNDLDKTLELIASLTRRDGSEIEGSASA